MKQFLLFFLLSIFVVVGAVSLNKYQKNRVIPKKQVTITPVPTKIISPTEAKSKSKSISLELIGVSDGVIVSDPTLLIKGKTVANADVFIDSQELKADKNGDFSAKVSLDEGENMIVITVNDSEGNTAEKGLTVNLETSE
jgi:hypothetical protein